MKKLLIYGVGNRGKNLGHLLINSKIYEIVGFVDANEQMWGTRLFDVYEVYAPEKIKEYKDVPICISMYDESVIQQTRYKIENEFEYDLGHEIIYEALLFEIFKNRIALSGDIDYAGEEKIIFDGYLGLGLGGTETWTKCVYAGLLERKKYSLRLLTDGKECASLEKLGFCLDVLNRESRFGVEDSFENLATLVAYFSTQLPCVVVINRPNIVLMAACILKMCYPDKIRLIAVVHSGTWSNYRRYAIFEEYVDLYVGVSSDIKKGLLDFGVKEYKIKTMMCPFVCEKELLRRYTLDVSKAIRIGYAGRIETLAPFGKRMDLILTLAEDLKRKGVKFVFELAGDGPGRLMMEEAIKERGLSAQIRFLGVLNNSEMMKFWKQQDICINLSDYEGRSISVIEAMGCGAIPIVSETSGVNDDIRNGENGYIVPVGSWSEAAKYIEHLSKNREQLVVMGSLAHDEVYPKSHLDKHVDFWEKCVTFKNEQS